MRGYIVFASKDLHPLLRGRQQRRVTLKLGCRDSSEKGLFSEASPRLANSLPKEGMFSRWPSIAREET